MQKMALDLQRKMKGDFEILWHKYVLWHKSATTPLQPIVLYKKKMATLVRSQYRPPMKISHLAPFPD